MKSARLADIRKEYVKHALDKAHVDADPMRQFGLWLEQAIESGAEEPTAMTLATATMDGIPSARIVLLKDFDEKGFTFYTNYLSRKGKELSANPHVALVFFWKELERQLRIEGVVEKVTDEESDAYFASRPGESQVSAIISPQSAVVPDRKYLEERKAAYIQNHSGPHKRPDSWGGYLVKPRSLEFWQGRPGRLHDRIRYTLEAGDWRLERLAP